MISADMTARLRELDHDNVQLQGSSQEVHWRILETRIKIFNDENHWNEAKKGLNNEHSCKQIHENSLLHPFHDTRQLDWHFQNWEWVP